MKSFFFFFIPVFLFSFFLTATPAFALSVGASPSSIRAEMLVGETGQHEIFFSALGLLGEGSFVVEVEGEAGDFLFIEDDNFKLQIDDPAKYLEVLLDTEDASVGHYEGTLTILYEVPASNASIGVRYGVSVALFIDVVDKLSDVEVINGITNSSIADQVRIGFPELQIEKEGEESHLIVLSEIKNTSVNRAKSLPYTISFQKDEEGGSVEYYSEDFIYYETLASGESVVVEQKFIVPEEIAFGNYQVVVSAGLNSEEIDLRLIDPVYYVALGIVGFLIITLSGTAYYLYTHKKKRKVKKKAKKKITKK
mgnify:CR=1 FL=1|jgi:hypothetical protein